MGVVNFSSFSLCVECDD